MIEEMFNAPVRIPDSNKGEARTLALELSYFGGLVGGTLGLRGGFARAAVWGVFGRVAGGALGIYRANHADAGKNLRAARDLASEVMVLVVPGAVLLCARNVPQFRPVVDRFLEFAAENFLQAGKVSYKLSIGLHEMGTMLLPRVSKTLLDLQIGFWTHPLWQYINSLSMAQSIARRDWNVRLPQIEFDTLEQLGIDFDESAATPTVNEQKQWYRFAQTIISPIDWMATFFEIVGKTLKESGKQEGAWSRSLAVGYVITMVVPQAVVVAEALIVFQRRDP